MEIRYYNECYNRTLVISFPAELEHIEKDVMNRLDQYYDEWVNFEGPGEYVHDMCLEEYMMERLSEIYSTWYEWSVEED